MNVRSQGHQGIFSCGKQEALAALQYGPFFQQWEQHRSQPAAEGDGGHTGWGRRGQLLHSLPGKSKNNGMLSGAAAREVPMGVQGLCQDSQTAGHCRGVSPGPGTSFVSEPC